MIIVISIAAFCATLLGGLFALRFKDRLHSILGFSAGAVIAVAFFDLIPEAIKLGGTQYSVEAVMAVIALGFSIYMVLDRLALLHSHDEDEHEHEEHAGRASVDGARHDSAESNHRGHLGAGSLSIHSLLDGVAIGLAFQVSAAVGAIVAIAVLVHDFSDGINTVNVVLKNGGDRSGALKWLFTDAIAPVLGVLATLFFSLSESSLGLVLALFAGFFLYIGASDLLPESHHQHPKKITTIMTILGIAALYIAIKLANL